MSMNPQVDAMLATRFAQLDRFDYVQLAEVLRVCAAAPSLSAAGRVLFAHTLSQRKTSNDADRLRKYLARFDLQFDEIAAAAEANADDQRRALADYQARPQRYGRRIKDLRARSGALLRDFEASAADAKQMADLHRQIASEMH
jgi:hypothetical protein